MTSYFSSDVYSPLRAGASASLSMPKKKNKAAGRGRVDPRTLYATASIPKLKVEPQPEPEPEPLREQFEPEPLRETWDEEAESARAVIGAPSPAPQHGAATAGLPPSGDAPAPAPAPAAVDAAAAPAATVNFGYRPPPQMPRGPAFGESRSVQLSAENERYMLGSIGGAAQVRDQPL